MINKMTGTALFTVTSALLVLMIFSTGCGSGLSKPSRADLSPAESIDPFTYGDEFLGMDSNSNAGTATANQIQQNDQTLTGQSDQVTLPFQPATPTNGITPVPDAVIYRIQLGGVFEAKDEADAYARRARNRLDRAVTVEYRAPFYRVYAGSFSTQRDAEAYIQLLRQEGFGESRWVPEHPTAQ